jgi:drug/metabolite transporter (DMT)-like permease
MMQKTEKIQRLDENRKSIMSLHIAVMLFGFSAVLGQFVDAPAVIVAGGRVVCSSILLLVSALLSKRKIRLTRRMDYGIAVIAGIILAIHWTTFFQSIQSSSVAIGTITFSTFPLFLTFLEPLVFHEKFQMQSLLGAAVLLLGVFITIPEFSMENQMTVGILWGMVSSLSYAILTLFNRYLSHTYEAGTICLYEQGTAAVVLLPTFFFVQTRWTVENIVGIAMIGLVCTAIAHSLYVAAQKKVKAQTAGIISGMETVYGIVFAMLFLGEVPGIREVIGGIIILCVAVLSSLAAARKEQKKVSAS